MLKSAPAPRSAARPSAALPTAGLPPVPLPSAALPSAALPSAALPSAPRSGPTRERSVSRDPEATREAILTAATDQFAEHALGGARVDRIA